MKSAHKREMNFELNLLPFISILAVCISFLLLTGVWVRVGSFNVKQALGDEGAETAVNPPTLWVEFNSNGNLKLSIRDLKPLPQNFSPLTLSAVQGKIDLKSMDQYAAQLRAQLPQVKTALVLPSADVSYDDVVQIMDRLKKSKLPEVGIAPL